MCLKKCPGDKETIGGEYKANVKNLNVVSIKLEQKFQEGAKYELYGFVVQFYQLNRYLWFSCYLGKMIT